MGINYFRRDDRDSKFVLMEHLDLDKLLAYEAFEDFTAEDLSMVLDEAHKVSREVLGPARAFPPVAKHIEVADKVHGIGTADPNKIELIKLGWKEDILI